MKNSAKQSYEVEISKNTGFTEDDAIDIDIEEDDDKQISDKIDMRLSEAKALHTKVCETAQDSMNLFRGRLEEFSDAKANKFKNKTVLSRIFLTIRNLVGLTTDSPAFVEVIPDTDSPKDLIRAKSIEANIEWQMLDNRFTEILAQALFDCWIKRDAYLHWFWNYEKDDIGVEMVSIEDLSISPEASDIQDAEFAIYHPYKNRAWWKKNYPKQYENIKFVTLKKDEITGVETVEDDNTSMSTGVSRGNVARFIQYWENDILVEKVQAKDQNDDIILKKVKNPYYEYRTNNDQIKEMALEINPTYEEELKLAGLVTEEGEIAQADISAVVPEIETFVPVTNYLTLARKPFVQIPSIKLHGELYSEEVTQQVREVFLSMNEKKRAFADNLRGCNQKIVVDGDTFTKDEASKITDEPNQVLRVSFQDNPKPVYIEKGGEVPRSFHEDIQHDEAYIDDLYGNHDISRGAGNAGTLGQDQMNFESDRTPIRFQTRATERAIVELVEGWLQLMKLFYTTKHYAKKYGEKAGMELIEIINEDIEQGAKPHIKPGSMIKLSKSERASRAVQLYGQNALDPYTMFAEMGMDNPTELADRLVNWLNFGMVSAEDPDSLQADQNADLPGVQSIERANQENNAMQTGENIPPTPPEYITEDHVGLHYAFLNDKSKKIEDEERELIIAHAEVDKASLGKLMVSGELQARQMEAVAPTEEK